MLQKSTTNGQFRNVLVEDGRPSGVLPMKKSFHGVANGRDGCTMVPFSGSFTVSRAGETGCTMVPLSGLRKGNFG